MTTLRSDADDAARRAYLGVGRGTLVEVDDSTKMQEVTVRARFGRMLTNVEHWHPYGFTSVPLKPDDQEQRQAEVLITYLGGSLDHPVVVGIGDRRHRPKNLKAGESSHHDDQRQHTHLTRDGVNQTGKKVTITGGDDGSGRAVKPATDNFELNEQLKGLAARLSQVEDSHHALFDVVSKFRQNAEQVVPALVPVNAATQVTNALSGAPTGLDAMKALAEGKLTGYLQNALQRGLKAFLDPGRLMGMTSLLAGNVESLIAGLEAQIAGLIANNPVIGMVDDLVDELEALNASGGPEAAIAAKTAELTGQIEQLTGANPVIGQIANLRGRLQQLADQAGPAMNFLEPQKRLVQGQTKSMRFGGPG
ncbi:phage gp45-like [Methylobacterium sp. PvP062]|uniref:Phage gp45-like n=1 Tax=Methylobacterium radiotolerans TaxID=31998 RepID=A0ABV2NQ07_9HYPH|nr:MULTISPECIES: phage baseplate assembly protein [unclassified Methylobacterium]MBP2494719.1 phage gp45-like [Methylobacterium sp. PvP105]MBP2505410.1 phage gp45-like [Methylobacterium sp. PvP109]MCX7336143.1 phage baseplate assembly protein [Hyphomicrobiales bacterium]